MGWALSPKHGAAMVRDVSAAPKSAWRFVGGKLKQIAAAGDDVWGVNQNNKMYKFDQDGRAWQGNKAQKLKQLSLAPGIVIGMDPKGQMRARFEMQAEWEDVAGQLTSISVASAGSEAQLKAEKAVKTKLDEIEENGARCEHIRCLLLRKSSLRCSKEMRSKAEAKADIVQQALDDAREVHFEAAREHEDAKAEGLSPKKVQVASARLKEAD